jgi:predicted small integral membrane protein
MTFRQCFDQPVVIFKSLVKGLNGHPLVMLPLRLAKIACVAALALYAGAVAFGNVADYWTNFAFVTHVLDMDQLPKESSIRWRAITSVTLHHAIYLLIIGTEIVIAT